MTFRQIFAEALRRARAPSHVLKWAITQKPLDPRTLDMELNRVDGERLVSELTDIFSNRNKLDAFTEWLEREVTSHNQRN